MADTTRRLAGIAFFTADGQNLMLAGDLAYTLSGVTRETLTGQDRVHGYAEKPSPGSVSATFRDSSSLSVAALNAMTNATITLELANGKTIIGRNMWTIEAQTVKTADATLEVKWEGPTVEEA